MTARTREEVERAFRTIDRQVRRKVNKMGQIPTKEEMDKREALREELRTMSVKHLNTRDDLKAISHAMRERENRSGSSTETKDTEGGEQQGDGA